MKRLFSLFAALAVGWLAVGGEPPITVNTVAAVSSTQTKTVNAADKPIVVAVGRFVPLGNPKGEPLLFELSDPSLASHVQIPAGGSFGGVPWDSADGKVLVRTFDVPTFILIVSGAGKLDVNVYGNGATTEVKDKDGKVTGKVQAPPVRRQTVSLLAGEGPLPPPKPKPDDDPKPKPVDDPVVKASKLSIVILEESQKRTTDHAKVIYDKEFRKWAADGGHTVVVLDEDNPVVATNGYGTYKDKLGVPCVLVLDSNGSGPTAPLLTFNLPASGSELITKCKKAVK